MQIKITPPKSCKYLYPIKDYDNFEFRSPVNIWDIQPKYKADFDKVKVLDINLTVGESIYIPAYWWYTIRYEKLSSICSFKYRTFMNSLAKSIEIVSPIYLILREYINFSNFIFFDTSQDFNKLL